LDRRPNVFVLCRLFGNHADPLNHVLVCCVAVVDVFGCYRLLVWPSRDNSLSSVLRLVT
jgi:hypothetical protein